MPGWLWPAVVVGCLLLLVVLDARRIQRGAARYRAIEAERIARENSAPLGSVERRVG